MINQLSNNKPSGYQSVDCDPGTPISGRTASNGSYQILKVANDGGLLTNGGVPASDVNYQIEAVPPTPVGSVGLIATTVIIANNLVVTNAIQAGWYQVSPSIVIESTGAGSVSVMLVKQGSPIEIYASTLILGTDPFALSMATANGGGMGCVWHNLPLNRIGSTLSYATGGNANVLEKTVYLEAGTYRMVVIVDTAITTTGGGDIITALNSLIQVA